MSAEILRKAAALMRERAEAATSGPWASHGVWVRQKAAWDEPSEFVAAADAESSLGSKRANVAHIASWHPAVALAVADWLDGLLSPVGRRRTAGSDCEVRAALAIARAYLGESA